MLNFIALYEIAGNIGFTPRADDLDYIWGH